MKYFLLKESDDNAVGIMTFDDKDSLLKYVFENYIEGVKDERKPIFVESIDDLELQSWDEAQRLLIIRGEIIKPTPIKVVDTWIIGG